MSPRPAFDALQISALDNTATLLKSVRISDEVVVGGADGRLADQSIGR